MFTHPPATIPLPLWWIGGCSTIIPKRHMDDSTTLLPQRAVALDDDRSHDRTLCPRAHPLNAMLYASVSLLALLAYIIFSRAVVPLPNMTTYVVPILATLSPFQLTYARSYHEDIGVLRYVNPKIGTYGVTPNGNGGMIPSVSPPFGMTRWTPQTRENFISQCPYNDLDSYIHGFQATHQPAIWMGESGQVVLSPGIGEVKPLFTQRAHFFSKGDEVSTAYVYEVTMRAESVVAGYNLTESIFSPVPGGMQSVPSDVSEGANGRTRRAVRLENDSSSSRLLKSWYIGIDRN